MVQGKGCWWKFLGVGLLGAIFFSSALPLGVHGAEKELSVMVWSHFIPDVDKELKAHAEQFGKAKGVKVRIDTIDLKQFVAKKAAEAQSRSGHDIIQNYGADAMVYDNLLMDVSALVEDLGKQYGGWIKLAEEVCKVEKQWKAVPWYYYPYPLVIRTDLIKKVGETPPDSWDDVLRIGKKMKELGKPVGIQLGHSRDGNAAMLALLWSYGASITAKDGKTVVLNSPETLKAIQFMMRLYKEAMPEDIISWDDAANNRAFLAGACSMTFNSPSIYKTAMSKGIKVEETATPLAEAMDHILPPRGPMGRFAFADPLSLGVWKFSKQADLAMEFIKYHFQSSQFNRFLDVAVGYNTPFLKTYRNHPVFTSDPRVNYVGRIAEYEHTLGYPGPVTAAAQQIWDLYIITDMFAFAVTGKKSPQEAIQWAEAEIKAIYEGRKK
jgi:multiple sugar transport system substrate-binding protein